MALNETDKAWIREQIRDSRKRHGLGKLAGFIKDWSGTGAAIAILLFAFTQWTSYVEFRTTTNYKLEDIEKKLTKSELRSQASLPQAVFEKALSDVRSSVAAARKDNIKASPKLIEDLQNKLVATSNDAPDFWPTVAEFVSYRSSSLSTPVSTALPNCTDSLPTVSRVVEVPSPTTINVGPGIYENCRMTLDSEEDNKRLNAILTGRNPSITFKHCLVIYRGGPVNLILAYTNRRVTIKGEGRPSPMDAVMSVPNTLMFEDCVFDFSLQATPPSEGQQFTETLLAQNGNIVKIPIGPNSN